jgi:DNA modification methylase
VSLQSQVGPVGECVFKTIYFPGERVRNGSSARVTLSIPRNHGASPEFLAFATQLSSRDFRLAIGDPFIEDLEAQAQQERRSFSDVCVNLLWAHYSTRLAVGGQTRSREPQLTLPFLSGAHAIGEASATGEPAANLGVTFRDSLRQRVFGWYPYVEGFSSTYTRDTILRYQPRTVYDPFGGSGTTQLAASCLGVPSFYSEINPFMCFVAETKVLASGWARSNFSAFKAACTQFERYLRSNRFDLDADRVDLSGYNWAFPGRSFFEEAHLRQLLAAIIFARQFESTSPMLRDLLLLACASNAVRSSNMTRRADLRRRRPGEYKNRVVDVPGYLSETLKRFVEDVQHLPGVAAPTLRVSDDARALPAEYSNAFDFALTSPPYLNGTNYFRNTKIELWLLGFIKSEDELGTYRRRAIAAGINNVTRDRLAAHTFERVEKVVACLNATDGDKRIPLLVRQYFSDMYELFVAVHRGLTPGGAFLLDIGDSKFYGVHVPTDQLLIDAAIRAGMVLEHRHVLARRHSRDKTQLVQVELVFQKPTRRTRPMRAATANDTLEHLATEFQHALPYKQPPYNMRSWGHALHSLCSYQGKLKPSMAHWIVRHFVPTGGRVLDPLGGVGTIPFEAALLGHQAVSNDKSPFAATVARAKLASPSSSEARALLDRWWHDIMSVPDDELDFAAANFGLNGAVKDFYHPKTLVEVLRARALFMRHPPTNDADAFLWASLLHVLHGNRPYALSRTSHPITPFHPKGPAVYKSVREKVLQRVASVLECPLPQGYVRGHGLQGDFRDLLRDAVGQFDAIITSPPFLGMRFDRPNWLRLWFCGWGESDFHRTSLGFLERQQMTSTSIYREFFARMRDLIAPTGLLIIHIGSGVNDTLVSDLRRLGGEAFHQRAEIRENVQAIEQHGIRDKGLTRLHHLLFFTPR